ncbi:MAG: HAD family hydrolase [Candidatus Lokiarchaeota archaeon]|nr:HAD family hydrolase [Candidatus Lokiarchaeota archaeon]
MMVKGIIFDFGFTLFYFDNPSVERYYECFKKGLVKSIDTLKEKQIWREEVSNEAFIKKFAKRREHFFRKSIKTKTEFPTSLIFQNVLESLREENIINDIDHIDQHTYDKLAEIYHSCEEDEWEPFENTRETLKKLTEKNLKIALISNHPNHQTIENMLKKHDLLIFFDYIMTSAKYGKRKPDPDIFLFTLEKMGLKNHANSVIVCGDEYADIIGAQRANLQSILLERKYKFPFEKEINISNLRKISNISEILDAIE